MVTGYRRDLPRSTINSEVSLADYLDTARKAIEDQLANLRQEVKRLEQAAQALAGGGPPRGAGPPRGRRRRRTPAAGQKRPTPPAPPTRPRGPPAGHAPTPGHQQ